MPPPCDNLLSRPPLNLRLDDAVDAGTVLVLGPAGSGKSQLVSDWSRHQRTPRDLAWITLGEGDRSSATFLRYVVEAVGSTSVGRHAMADLQRRRPLPGTDEGYQLELATSLATISGELVLVLDGFEQVIGSETEHLLHKVLAYPPDQVRLVVLSRAQPALRQARLRMQGLLRELGPQDLAFTPEETGDLLALGGVRVSGDARQLLQDRTGGWAAGLAAVVGSLAGGLDPSESIRTFDPRHTLAAEFLMTDVFEEQPPELQEFLLDVTVADPVCGRLADALVARPGSEQTLAELVRSNLFLHRADDLSDETDRWYRWHPMFAATVRERLTGSDPERAAALHRTAADWLRGRGLPLEAARHAFAGGDPDTATMVLADCWLDLMIAGETTQVRSLLSLFDEGQVATNPELAGICAFVRLQDRELGRASQCAVRATRLAGDLPQEAQLAVEVLSTVVLLHAATMSGTPGYTDCHAAALGLLDRMSAEDTFLTEADRERRALLLYHLGAFEVSRWTYDDPSAHLYEAMAEAALLDMPLLVLRCRSQLASLDLFSGFLERARHTALEIVTTAEARGWHSYHNLAGAELTLGGVEAFRANTEEALRHLAEARRCVHPVDLVNRFRIGFLAQLAHRTAENPLAARAELDFLHTLVERWPDAPEWARTMVTVAEAEQLVCEQHPEQARQLMESVPESPRGSVASQQWRGFYGRLLVDFQQPLEARAVVAPVIADAGEWPIGVVALVVDALAADSLGLRDEALDTLTSALVVTARERVFQPFVASGRQLRPLFQELLDRGSAYESEVLEILDRVAAREDQLAPLSKYYMDPLTPRELEVLRELQGTESAAEVADRLFVSLNTLRTHIKHINRKLDATSRRTAVLRARELGIL